MNCYSLYMQQYVIELFGAAEKRKVDIYSQVVLHRYTSGDHERDGWQGRIPEKGFLNIAGMEEEGSHYCSKGKNSAQMLLGDGGKWGQHTLLLLKKCEYSLFLRKGEKNETLFISQQRDGKLSESQTIGGLLPMERGKTLFSSKVHQIYKVKFGCHVEERWYC